MLSSVCINRRNHFQDRKTRKIKY